MGARQRVAGPGGSATDMERDFKEVRQIGTATKRRRNSTERDLVAAGSATKGDATGRSAHIATLPLGLQGLGSTKDKSLRYLHASCFRGRW